MRIQSYILISGLLASFNISFGQTTDPTFIENGGNVYIESGTNASIFGDLKVDGNFQSKDNGTTPRVELYGENITLDSNTADMRAFPYGDHGAIFAFGASVNQKLTGGSKNQADTMSFFPNVELNNSNNVNLVENGAGATNDFNFLNGKVIHDLEDFTVGGPTHAGLITGYDESKYFVTNGTFNPETHGYFYRYSTLNTDVDYPIGPDVNHYEPARLMTATNPGQFKSRVFHGVSAYGFDDTLETIFSCGFTWDLYPTQTSTPTTNITLSHTVPNEGSVYAAAPDAEEFITHYVGYSPNWDGGDRSNTNWDRLVNGSPLQAMDIHDGTITSTYKQHIRLAQTDFSLFSKAINSSLYPLNLKEIILRAINENNEYAILNWNVDNEDNIDHYTIAKSEDAGSSFIVLQDKQTPAQNQLEYNVDDYEVVPGKTYYYIVTAHDLDAGDEFQSNIAMVQFFGENRSIVLYPNPAKNHISINYQNGKESTVKVQLLTQLGQILDTKNVHSRTGSTTISFDVSSYADGDYIMYITDDSGNSAESIKFQILR